ncbi:rhodanese-like domain-containing protein [Runella slithyformis]|uniref:Rhodanese-like protein n=1 Tax=Runella slithyformis (strain ATCC 29530 / DSM 19594 / LMG 11500 / NCIMB 11436 / LSU 4) TaxID=761193 RepID=A0A7U4E716_RUNSL|nr:rhodanese-like domain-containing protein [Runella slithyformis]AEI49899.1 Rhodanese-like protein [Runella slithyformis DSM 19594]
MKNTLFIFGLILGAGACTGGHKAQTIDAKTFQSLIDTLPDEVVVDVRTSPELVAGVISQAAIHMDYNGPDFEKQIDKLDKNKPVLLYCATGGRSARAGTLLLKKGFKKVYNLDGGLNGWRAAGYSTAIVAQ